MEDILELMKSKFTERRIEFKDALVRQIKTEVPKHKFPPTIRNWAFTDLSDEDKMALIQEFGPEKVNRALYERHKSQFDKRRTK